MFILLYMRVCDVHEARWKSPRFEKKKIVVLASSVPWRLIFACVSLAHSISAFVDLCISCMIIVYARV